MPEIVAAGIAALIPATGATALTIGGTTVTVAAIAGQVVFSAAAVGAQYLLALGNKPRAPVIGITNRQSDGPRFFVTGRGRIGGQYLFEEAIVGGWYGMGIIFNCGPTDAIEKIEIDDRNMAFGAFSTPTKHYSAPLFIPDRFFIYVDIAMGYPAGYASPWLIDKFPTLWTSDHKAQGLAVFYGVMAKPKAEIFNLALPNGKPLPQFTIRGALVHDPREPSSDPDDDPYDPSTWSWSDNPILQAAFYAIHPEGGVKLDPDEIDWDSVAAAADICDASVAAWGGATEPFARAGTTWTTAEPARDVLGRYMAACDGYYEEGPDGRLRFGIAQWVEPTVTLTGADLGAVQVDYDAGRLSAVNRYELTFTDPARGYKPNATFLVEDTDSQAQIGIKAAQIYLEAVQSPTQAYRMGVRLMRREIGKRRVTAKCGPAGLLAVGERFVNLDAPEKGIVGTFRVLPVEGEGRLAEFGLSFVEVAESDYADVSIPADPAETIPLLNESAIETPINLVVTKRPGAGGTFLQASVDPPSGTYAGQVVDVEFEWREDLGGGSYGDWTPFIVATGTWSAESEALPAGDYEVQARFINVSGQPGSYGTAVAVTIGSTAPDAPASVSATGDIGAINMQATAANDAAHYGIRFWLVATAGGFGAATQVGDLMLGAPNATVYHTETGLAAGDYDIYATAESESGDPSSEVGPVNVTVT